MLLDLPTNLLQLVISYLPTEDLVAVSHCCSLTNFYSNYQLYRRILITENNLLKPRTAALSKTPYTILKKGKLSWFIESLSNNRALIPLVQHVTIITSSSLTNSYATNDYEPLYYMLLSSNSNLRYLNNLDYNNVKKCENFLQFNHSFISRKNFKKDFLYENDDLSIDSNEFLSKIANLENYQVGSLNDFRLIQTEASKFTKLSIMIEQVYNERIDIDDFQLTDNLIKRFAYLKTLELNSTISAEIFFNKILNLKPNVVRFSRLETLSLTYMHSIRSHFDLLLDLRNFDRMFYFDRLKNLELKLNCDDINCQFCIDDFFSALIPRLTNVRKLSVVYITNENLLANSRTEFDQINNNINTNNGNQADFRSMWTKTIFHLAQLQNLEYLYLNLNDFTFIPFLKMSSMNTSNLINIFNFNISQEYLSNKKSTFEILRKLALSCLVLPDFFYNWKLFDVEKNDIDYNLQFLSYLNKCDCEDCNKARLLFKAYSESFEFIDNNRLSSSMSTSYPTHFKFPIKSKNLSMTDVKNYRFFYNSLIRNLKQRLPYTDKIFKNQSGLTILDKPFNEFYLIEVVNDDYSSKRNHYNSFISLIVHNLYDDVKRFITANRRLRRLVLGGIYFEIENVTNDVFVCKGAYDDFNFTISI